MGKGTFEIERRYLVRVPGALWDTLGSGRPLRQGYVATGSTVVRIRVGEARGPVLTCKVGGGVRRREIETVVSAEMAEALLLAAGERVIEKVRYPIGRWELDRFEGGLKGLVLLEIELDDVDESVGTPPEGIHILREVTDDNRFTNSHLACMTQAQQRSFVAAVYAEAEGV